MLLNSMPFYLTAAWLWAMLFFWGAGLACLLLPARWRKCWPLLALPAGLGLQSAVVWAAGWLPVAGTQAYGRMALLLPLALLAIAWWTRRRMRVAFGCFPAAVLVLSLLVALLAVSPWARRGGGLTTITNGSCDAADYAAGARVLGEFRPDDRSGFIGQREVAGILTVDNFYAHWRRLNHFTPAALLALNATLTGRAVEQLAGVLGAVLLAALVPVAALLARAVVRLPRRSALAFAALIGIGPIQAYAVYQVALGQLLACAGVMLFAWSVTHVLSEATAMRRVLPWAGVLVLSWWLLVGSYTFFLVVALAPVAGAVAWWVCLGREGLMRAARTAAVVGLAGVVAGLFGWERLAGFALRWRLHDTVEYGWPIPWQRPDGWLGLVGSADLGRLPDWGGWLLSAGLLAAMIWPLLRRFGWRTREAWTAAGLVGPAVIGYVILTVKGTVPGSHASYDAYKLLACFQPALLAGLLGWWRWLRGWPAVWLPVVIVGAVAASGAPLRTRAAQRPLEVDANLAALRQVEAMPEVKSVNILCGTMWSRLWANAFLLRKEQYFAEPTYEGRRPTRLAGEWSLVDSILRVEPASGQDLRVINREFALLRTGVAHPVRADFAANWHEPEKSRAGRWRWAAGAGEIVLRNSAATAQRMSLRFTARGLRPGPLRVTLNGVVVGEGILDTREREIGPFELAVPPGDSRLVLEPEAPAVSPGAHDNRRLSVALYALSLRPAP